MTEPELPPCGHPECARDRQDAWALARSLGFTEVEPGVLTFATHDPAQFLEIMKVMNSGVDGAVADIIAQAEALAQRAADVGEEMHRNRNKPILGRRPPLTDPELAELILQRRGGRVAARKVGPRAIWEEVRKWFRRQG